MADKKKTFKERYADKQAAGQAGWKKIFSGGESKKTKSANPESTVEKKKDASGPRSVDPSKLETRGVDTKKKPEAKKSETKKATKATPSMPALPVKHSPSTRKVVKPKPKVSPDARTEAPKAAKKVKHSPPTRKPVETASAPKKASVASPAASKATPKSSSSFAQAKRQGMEWDNSKKKPRSR